MYATHIVGGELNYTCLGNNLYEVSLTVYRDCFYGEPWFDDPASVGIFNSENLLVGQLLMEYTDDDTLNERLGDPCFVIPPDVCVHTTTYKDTVALPFREGGYTLVYQRCCRNQTILNIVDPLESGATYLVRITEATLLECNSNAKFKDWPPIYICVDQPIDFDHGAIDPDGDSLVYRLCTPLLGASQFNPRPQPPNNPPYDSVVWVDPPYSLDNMLGGDPLTIDPNTGFLTGVPNTIGQFVVGICVEEYRDGELISVTRRDFQYNVGECGATTAAFFTAEFYCENQSLTIDNQSTDADSFRWNFDAPAYRDTVILAEDPTFTDVPPGIYTLELLAFNERGCSDTFQTEIEIRPVDMEASFEVNLGECTDSVTLNVINTSIVGDTGQVDTIWYILIDDSLQERTPPFRLAATDSALIILELLADNGCPDRDTFVFYTPFPEFGLADSLFVCRGDQVALFPDADPECEYSWSPSDDLDDPDLPNPLATPGKDILYTVTISKPGQCDQVDSVFVKVLEPAMITSLTLMEDSVIIGDPNTVFYNVTNFDSLVWIPDDIIVSEAPGSIEVVTESSLLLTLIALNESGCNDTAQIQLVTFIPPCEEPYIFIPNAFSPNADGVNDHFKVHGKVLNDLEGFVYNRWGEKVFTFNQPSDSWNGEYNGKQAPVDGYGYYIRYQCIPGGPYTVRKGNVSLIR